MRSKTVQTKHIPDKLILGMIAESFATPIGAVPLAYRRLMALGFPEKVIYAKYDKLDRRGLLEWGISLRTAWLSDDGQAYLAKLQEQEE